MNSRKLFEIHYTKTCLKTIEKNLYRNNNYKLLKNLIALNDKHLYDMRLLLLGCTGLVGKELIPTLLNENHEIYIVSRKPISKLKLDLDFNKFKFFQIDLSKEKNWNNENLLNILKETDGIINLMGEPIAEKKWTYSQKQKIKNSRINTTKLLMKTLKISKSTQK